MPHQFRQEFEYGAGIKYARVLSMLRYSYNNNIIIIIIFIIIIIIAVVTNVITLEF